MDFEERDALHYVVYDLEPLRRVVLAARLRADDWLDLKGSTRPSLKDALDWLTPYAQDDKTHEEFVHARVAPGYQRRDAALSGYAGVWDPELSSNLYAMATILDSKYAALSHRLKPPAVGRPPAGVVSAAANNPRGRTQRRVNSDRYGFQ